MDDLDGPAMTEKIITETVRLFPPVYAPPRRATTDRAVDGYRIPEGARIMLGIRETRRDGHWFEDPDAFRPGRRAATCAGRYRISRTRPSAAARASAPVGNGDEPPR